MKKILFVFLGAMLLLTGIGESFGQVNIIPTRDAVAGFNTWTDTDIEGTSYLQLKKATASTTTPAMNFDNYTGETLNFKARTFGGTDVAENTITVAISVNNGIDWTVLGTRLPLTNGMVNMDEFDLSAYSGTEVKIKFYVEGTDDNKGAGIDDISITGFAPDVATLVANPTTLSGFNYIVGSGPSAEQSFELSGTDLDGTDVIITTPTNYEISQSSGTGFQSTPTSLITYNGSSTQVYVRLIAGLAVGDYDAEVITISGGDADDITVTCNGSVSAIPSPTLVVDPVALSGFTYGEGNGPSNEQSLIVSGTTLNGGDVTITPTTNYEISLTTGTGFQSTPLVLSSFDGTATSIYVRLKAGLPIGTYDSDFMIVNGGGATNIIVPFSGSVLDPSLVPCLAEDFSGFTAGAHGSPSGTDVAATLDDYTQLTGWEGYRIYPAGGEIKIGASGDLGYIITPTVDLSAGGTLNFDYAFWSDADASSVQVFHASDGTNFVQIGIDLTPALDFQSYSVNITDGTTLSKIKIGTDVKRAYLDNIEVYCNGFLPIPTLTSNPTSLSGFNYVVDLGPSAEQSFELSGTDLDGTDVIITTSTNYEISQSSGTGFQSTPIALTTFDGSATIIYVRLKSDLAIGDYNSGLITISGGDANDITVLCSGSVSDTPSPTLVADPVILSGFYYTYNSGPSEEKSFVLSGSNLDGSNVIVTPPANYQISEIPTGGFQNSTIILSAFDGADRNIFVRLKEGLDVGTYDSDIITISGGGADDVTVSLNGTVEAELIPVLTANPVTLSDLTYIEDFGPSNAQVFEISGVDLDGSDVSITPTTNYKISLSSGTEFQSTPIILTSFDGTATSIYVRLKSDLAAGDYNSESILISGGDAEDITVICSGTVLDVSTFPCLLENFSGFTGGNHVTPSGIDVAEALDDYTQISGWEGYKIYPAGGEIKIGTGSLNGYIITPSINLTDGGVLQFEYAQWSSDISVLQVFHASDGTNFVQVGNDLSPTTDFQSYSVQITGGTELSKIKIGTDVKRAFLDNIEIYCAGTAPNYLLIADPTSLSGFNYTEGFGPSEEQSFSLSGEELNGSAVNITPSANYEISSTSGTGFQSTPITLSAYNGSATSIYVRLKAGLLFGDYYSELITIAGGGADNISITCNGTVDEYVNASQFLADDEITIYPNPTSDFINIKIENCDSETVNIKIFDMMGKIVFANEFNVQNGSINEKIDFTKFSSGLYQVNILDKDSNTNRKVTLR